MLGFSSRPVWVGQLDSALQRLPEWLRPYVIALAELGGIIILIAAILRTAGLGAAPFCSFLLVLFVIGAAWNGYGPGLLVCALALFVVPPMLAPDRPHSVDPTQLALLVVILLLVSRLSASTKRTAALLRQNASDLERRVEERSLALEGSEHKLAWLAAIVKWSDDAIIGETLDGVITSWNRGAQELYGYTAEEVMGRSVAFLFPPESGAELDSNLRRTRSGEVIHRAETVRLHKDGRPIVVSLTISPIRDGQGAIQGASTIARDMTERRAVRQALENSENRYRLLFENNPQPMWVYDQETLAFLTVNETAVNNYGYSREEFLGMTLKDIRPAEDVAKLLEATAVPITELNREGPWRHRKKDGQIIRVEITEHPLVYEGRPGALVMATDITERLRLEEQFRQAQRLESVGRLAGGVAHDFNNLLTVINGYAEMLVTEAAVKGEPCPELHEIRGAGDRAAALTAQLLAFSRRQLIQPSVININTVVQDTERMLSRLIGEDIELVMRLAPDLGLIEADTGQIQQIVMNLAINSRDAMEDGGTLLIETCNIMLDESYRATHPELRPGPHVMLAITDTGSGMSPAVRARLFEPFFTTKELGKGTGLGLATVYGMVKQSGGWIWVYSEPNRGTTFKIYLPRTDKAPATRKPVRKLSLRGHETILVVEDEAEVRKLALAGLSDFGYTVHGASTGREAIDFCREFSGIIDLVLTDVIMTDMNGREVARRIGQVRPETSILFMSGYTANVIAHHGVLEEGVEYLQKPFTPDSLAQKVREVLERKSGAQNA
jgi:two-component system, cell cycle sensor histidine kinase and response regulator CckA